MGEGKTLATLALFALVAILLVYSFPREDARTTAEAKLTWDLIGGDAPLVRSA